MKTCVEVQNNKVGWDNQIRLQKWKKKCKERKKKTNHLNIKSDNFNSRIIRKESLSFDKIHMFMYPDKVSSKHKSNLFKSLSPKLTLRREWMAENLKYKAEELIMKRIQKESIDKIINQNIEDIDLNENDTTKDIICSQMAHNSKELFRIRSLQQSKCDNDNV